MKKFIKAILMVILVFTLSSGMTYIQRNIEIQKVYAKELEEETEASKLLNEANLAITEANEIYSEATRIYGEAKNILNESEMIQEEVNLQVEEINKSKLSNKASVYLSSSSEGTYTSDEEIKNINSFNCTTELEIYDLKEIDDNDYYCVEMYILIQDSKISDVYISSNIDCEKEWIEENKM